MELVIHLEGDVLGHEADTVATVPSLHGPGFDHHSPTRRPMSRDNTGSVTRRFDIRELRPRETYRCGDSDVVLVIANPAYAAVRGTWAITARDHHRVYKSEVIVSG